MFNPDYSSHPAKAFRQILKEYSNSVLVLQDVLNDRESFLYVYQDMVDLLKYGLEYKLVREFPISFSFHKGDKVVYQLQCRHFLSNMVMWSAYMEMDCVDVMDESFIIDWVGKDVNFIGQWIDDMVVPYAQHIGHHELNAIISEVIFHIRAISDTFCLQFGYSASIWDIMQAEKANPQIHDILYEEIDPNLQVKEMEDKLEALNVDLIHAFEHSDSDLRPLLLSGKNISKNQFQEIFLRIGYKADISNRTIPFFIDSNLLITGIDTPAAYYIEAESGRRALMATKLSMSKPGALSKKVNHNTTTTILRKDHEHCNSTRPLHYLIEDEVFLKLLNGRWYYDESGELKMLNSKTDEHLIGKTVAFKSPCTCTSQRGICEQCYGKLFDINDDLFSQGSFASTVITQPVGQLVLKSKHEQHTSSDEITFSDDFYKNFDLSGTEVTPSDSAEEDLMIQLGPVQVEETDDGDAYYVESFFLLDYNGEIKAEIKEEHGFYLYLAKEFIPVWRQFKDKPIPLAKFDDDDESTVLFNIEVKSKAITQSLQQIQSILDSKDHMGYADDLDGLCQKYARILIDAGIPYNLVHMEMIVRALLRKKNNELEFPDFGPNGDHEDYTILRLTSSLSKNPSPIIRLSTGWLKKSLIGTSLYKAHAPSHFDPLFVSVLADVI